MGQPETDHPEMKEKPTSANIAVLVSNKGTGSNLQAIIDAQKRGELATTIKIVVSDREEAQGIQRAKDNNIPSQTFVFQRPKDAKLRDSYRNAYSTTLANILNTNGVQIAVLAGWGTILSASYFETFQAHTINIHPGLIPDKEEEPFLFTDGTQAPWNRGMMTEKAVENFLPLKYAGSTIHIATLTADFGPVLKRVIVPRLPGDDVKSLYARLKLAEHEGLIEVLKNPPIKKRV